jgi:hypothetical protein
MDIKPNKFPNGELQPYDSKVTYSKKYTWYMNACVRDALISLNAQEYLPKTIDVNGHTLDVYGKIT